jgi:pentapeptide repeat protein
VPLSRAGDSAGLRFGATESLRGHRVAWEAEALAQTSRQCSEPSAARQTRVYGCAASHGDAPLARARQSDPSIPPEHQPEREPEPEPELRETLRLWSQAVAEAHRPPRLRLPGTYWATRVFTVRFLRNRTDALTRALSLQLAVGTGSSTARTELDAIDHFRRSLPPPASRVGLAALGVALVVAIRFASEAVASRGIGRAAFVNESIARLTSPDAVSVGDFFERLLHSDPVELTVFVAVACFVSALVLCGIATGYARAEKLVGGKAAHCAPPQRQLGISAAPFDLVVETLLAAALFLYGLAAVRFQSDIGFDDRIGPEIKFALFLGIVGLASLVWIGAKWRGKAGFVLFAGLCVSIAALGALNFVGRPSAERRFEEFRAEHDLRGSVFLTEDLRGEDFVLRDLTGADLTGSILTGMNLAKVRFVNANLHGAILRGANLFGSRLCGAKFDGADLTDANVVDATYDEQTTWPNGFDPREAGARRVSDDHCH